MVDPAAPPPEGVVLVIDDEEAVRRMMARILTTAGFRVWEAYDGAEALRLLANPGPQIVWLVVSDVVMPRMTGEDLASTIAQKWPAVQVLLLSAQTAPHESFTGSFLQKPFGPETLVAAVSALLPTPKAPVG
jgi:DNA-binding response OmpR family regulator